MEEEQGIIRGESYECDWCGVTFTSEPITTKRKKKFYCSLECCRTRDFPIFFLMALFGFLAGISSLILSSLDVSNPGRSIDCLLGIIIGFIGFYCSLDTWKIRRRIPRGSKKEQYLDRDIG